MFDTPLFDSRARNALLALAVLLGAVLGGTAAATAAENASVSLERQDDVVVVPPADGATIDGTSKLPPGSNVTVRVQSVDDAEPRFIRTKTVSVGEGGDFAATFNFSRQSDGDAFRVTVRRDGTEVASADGEFRAAETASTAARSATGATAEASGTSALGPGFGVGLAVIAVVAAAALFGYR